MNKKISKMLMFLLIGAGLAIGACSKDTTGDSGDGGDGGDLTGPSGYLTIRLTGGVTGRNTIMETEDGDPSESFVGQLRVVLYDKETRKVAYYWDLDASNMASNGTDLKDFEGSDVAKTSDSDPAPADPTTNRFFMVPKKVVKKDYLMLVIANPHWDVLDATVKGKSMSEFEAAAKFETASDLQNLIGATTNKNVDMEFCMMSNARGYVDVFKADIKDTPALALENGVPKEVLLDRIVAKVTVGGWPQFINGTGDFSTFTWRLDGTNKKTFWMRKLAITADGAMEIYHDPRGILYAEDPNFDGFSNDRIAEGGGSSFPNLADEFTRIVKTDLTNRVDGDSWEYALENTMGADEQWEDVTTRVVLKGNFIPDTFTADESYYFFQGKAYKHIQIETMMFNDLWTGHEDLKAAVEADAAAGPNKKFNFVASNSGSIAGAEPTESVASEEGIRFYKSGISYYYVLLRHFNDSQKPDAMSYGRYGIVRNNVYKVNVNNISGPGDVDIPKPEGPDDKGEGYLSADINIQPWYIRDQHVEDL